MVLKPMSLELELQHMIAMDKFPSANMIHIPMQIVTHHFI